MRARIVQVADIAQVFPALNPGGIQPHKGHILFIGQLRYFVKQLFLGLIG